jgi:ABC-type glutathione transport system ATPase component
MKLLVPTAGRLLLDGRDVAAAGAAFRRRVQLVPQDPRTSLNPTISVRTTLEFQLRAQRVPRREWETRMTSRLEQVSLTSAFLDAFPHELSGGQAQRVAIARAILNDPDVLVCDEAVSALDKSVQAQVLNTLADLQRDSGVSMVFISHDLGVVEHMADQVLVLYRGKVVDAGPTDAVLDAPTDPYTRELLAARSESSLAHYPHPGQPGTDETEV